MYKRQIKFIGINAEVGHTYQTKIQQKTGYDGDPDILNNIDDLENNNFEWTSPVSYTHLEVYKRQV